MRIRTLAALTASLAISIAAPSISIAKTHGCPKGRPAGPNCGLHKGRGHGKGHHGKGNSGKHNGNGNGNHGHGNGKGKGNK